MKEFIKSRGIAFWLAAATALLTLIGMILMLVSSASAGYEMKGVGGVVAAAVAAIAFVLAAEVLEFKLGDKPWLLAFAVAAAALLCFAFGFVLANRVGVASAIFSWDAGNIKAETAFYTAVVSMVLYFVAVVAVCVSAFLKRSRGNA